MQQSFKNHFIKNAPKYYFRLFIIAAQFSILLSAFHTETHLLSRDKDRIEDP